MTRDATLTDLIDRLCPMHLVLDASGHIRKVGATLQKLRPDSPLPGRRFLEVFELTRPRSVGSMAALMAAGTDRVHLQFRTDPRTAFKGLVVPLPANAWQAGLAGGAGSGDEQPGPDRPAVAGAAPGCIVNLSFGISVVDAVRDYALTSADFAATDLTVELLYLVEAKSAAMEASRTLNLRLQGAMIAAEEQAFTDTLTGLKNRRALDHVVQRLLDRGAAFAMMHMDLDYFKSVNDTLGHAAGDHVLQHVARIMVEEVRDHDTVARIGGDEFVLVFDRMQDRNRIDAIARRLIARLEDPIPFRGDLCHISASAGTVLVPHRSGSFGAAPGTSPQTRAAPGASDLLHAADLALYAAKHAGRACHRFYRPEMAQPGAMSPPEPKPGRGPPRPAQGA